MGDELVASCPEKPRIFDEFFKYKCRLVGPPGFNQTTFALAHITLLQNGIRELFRKRP